MSVTGLLHHLDLTVTDLARSRDFYDLVLGALGYARVTDYEDGAADWGLSGALYPSIGIHLAQPGRPPHDRYAPGLHHLALRASSRAEVDQFHQLLTTHGLTILDAPAAYPEYGQGYYAVFFADPDGLKLECVYSEEEIELPGEAGAVGDYGADLAYVHHAGFGGVAEAAGDHLVAALHAAGIEDGRVVDLGCGAGGLLARTLAAGFAGHGVDASHALLEIAKTNAPGASYELVSVYQAEIPEAVAVTATGEVFNYILPGSDDAPALEPLFERVFAALQPGGLFIFDVIVVGEPEIATSGYRAGADWAVLSSSREDPRAARLTREITTFRMQSDGSYRRSDEVHRVRVLSADLVRASLAKVGFEVATIGAYGDHLLLDRRIGFEARKPLR